MKCFTIIVLGITAGLILNSGCGVSSLLQCGDDVPCDLNASGSDTTVLGHTKDAPVDSENHDPFNVMADPQYAGDLNQTGVPVPVGESVTGNRNRSAMDGSIADANATNANLTDAEMTALIANDPLLMSIFGLEDIPFLLSSYFDNLLIDSLSPAGGRFSGMTFLQRLCIDEGFPEYQCRQRYGR